MFVLHSVRGSLVCSRRRPATAGTWPCSCHSNRNLRLAAAPHPAQQAGLAAVQRGGGRRGPVEGRQPRGGRGGCPVVAARRHGPAVTGTPLTLPVWVLHHRTAQNCRGPFLLQPTGSGAGHQGGVTLGTMLLWAGGSPTLPALLMHISVTVPCCVQAAQQGTSHGACAHPGMLDADESRRGVVEPRCVSEPARPPAPASAAAG